MRLLALSLLPLAVLYWCITYLRNLMYDWGIRTFKKYDLPVICVGNITVGGTGKTPHIEYLVRIAEKSGVETACLSRGYKRKSKGFVLHTPGMETIEIGDEPKQIADKFESLHVAVCENRIEGIDALRSRFPSLNCILLDDAFQHRRVQPSLTILLTDYSRPIWDDWVFPSGMMREGYYARLRAHIIVVSKCPADMSADGADDCRRKLALKAWQRLFFSTVVYGGYIDIRTGACCAFNGDVSIVTGIAQHDAFVAHISSHAQIKSEAHFADHHSFTAKELYRIFSFASKHGCSVVTTEKDASRIKGHMILDEFPHVPVLYVPIAVEILFGQAAIFDKIVADHISGFGN